MFYRSHKLLKLLLSALFIIKSNNLAKRKLFKLIGNGFHNYFRT